MKSVLFLVSSSLALAVNTWAAPTLDWSPSLAAFYSVVDKHVQEARGLKSLLSPTCDLSKAVLPTTATSPLPAPDPSWSLASVVIGRGVQNYTCANDAASTTPTAIGAVADLYNVSCIAANYPDLLNMLPGLALQYPYPAPADVKTLAPSNLILEGHHYFSSNGTPTFDLTYDPQRSLGVLAAKKAANTTAPTDAIKGQYYTGDGAIPWLKLVATYGTQGDLVAVYRVNTAGGNPPKTCQGQTAGATISVQYAAEYWFYSK